MKLPPANVVPVGKAIGSMLPIGGTDNWQPSSGLNSWAELNKAASVLRVYGKPPTHPSPIVLTDLPDSVVKTIVARSRKPVDKLYVAIAWDGTHGEAVPGVITNRLRRKIRWFERHRHLCRQHFPKEFR